MTARGADAGDGDGAPRGDEAEDATAALRRLLAARARDGADRAAIDARIWARFGEEWAVVFTDLSGFSRQVARFGIIHFLQVIHEQEALLLPVVRAHGGRHVKTEADSLLLLFATAPAALAAALEMQRACAAASAGRDEEDRVVLCVGIGVGRVLRIGDADVFGHEVNLASKLGEDVARGGEILLTHAAHAACAGVPGVSWTEVRHPYVDQASYYRAAPR